MTDEWQTERAYAACQGVDLTGFHQDASAQTELDTTEQKGTEHE